MNAIVTRQLGLVELRCQFGAALSDQIEGTCETAIYNGTWDCIDLFEDFTVDSWNTIRSEFYKTISGIER